jgi:hypothetical protein
MRRLLLLIAVFSLLCNLGCGSKGVPGYKAVSGSVTLDGQPLDQGLIQFQPQGGGGVNGSARIEAGKYALPEGGGLPVGSYKVAISSTNAPAATSSDPMEAMNQAGKAKAEERIPAQYNSKTTLTATVTDNGEQVFNFDVKSK